MLDDGFSKKVLPRRTRQTTWRASAEKAAKSTDFDCKFCDFMSQLTFLLYFGCMDLAESETRKRLQAVCSQPLLDK